MERIIDVSNVWRSNLYVITIEFAFSLNTPTFTSAPAHTVTHTHGHECEHEYMHTSTALAQNCSFSYLAKNSELIDLFSTMQNDNWHDIPCTKAFSFRSL